MKRFVLSKQAERDLEQIKNFLAEKAGPRIARRVLKDIRSALKFLSEEPGAGHVREDLTERPVKFWPVHSYLILYNAETTPVMVIRVLHGMRDVEQILT